MKKTLSRVKSRILTDPVNKIETVTPLSKETDDSKLSLREIKKSFLQQTWCVALELNIQDLLFKEKLGSEETIPLKLDIVGCCDYD